MNEIKTTIIEKTITEIIEKTHNVVVDNDQYNIGSIDSTYGWQPIPDAWYAEARAILADENK